MTNGNKSANKQGVQFDVAPLPNQEAIVHFKDKVLLDSSSYLDVLAHEHAIAFVVAGMADADLLAETKAAIQSALDSGSDFNAFKRRLKLYLTTKGWLPKTAKPPAVACVSSITPICTPLTPQGNGSEFKKPKNFCRICNTCHRCLKIHVCRISDTMTLSVLWMTPFGSRYSPPIPITANAG